jgi:hypothetical protein
MEDERDKADLDQAVKLVRGGEYLLLLRGFWNALRSAWPVSRLPPS